MSLLLPIGLGALLLAVPIVILHMLTPRRPATSVSSLLHWDGLKHAITAAEPWQKLRWSLLLILQLAAVALFALALARPAVLEEADLAEHTVFIVDASGSMSAIDGDPDRLGTAIEEAKGLREELPDQGIASLVVASPRPAVLVSQSEDQDEFARAADTIRTMAGAADLEATFALAESLVLPERETDFVLLSDGQLTENEQKLAPLGTRYVPIGQTDTNRAITDLSVNSGPGGMQARVTIESTGGPDAIQVLRLDVDGVTVLSEEIEIPSGEVTEETFELPSGTRVAAYLDGEDLLAYDNQRYVGAPALGTLSVRVHGESRFFIDQLLAAIPEIDIDVAPGEDVDFEIYAGEPVPAEPDVPFIAIDAPGGAPGILPTGRIENPIPTLVASHPLLEDIDVGNIAIAEAQALDVTEGEVVLGAPGAPLIVESEANGVPFYYLAFTLEQSNLPIDVAYPIIGARMVGGLATSDGVVDALTVGEQVPLNGAGTITDPRGNTAVVSAGDSEPVADLAGFWTIAREGAEPFDVAVNADSSESDLAPRTELVDIRPAPESEPLLDATTTIARTLLPWVLAALLVVLAAELYVSYRSRGVPVRQWRVGLGVRAVVVGLIVLALFNPSFTTSSDDVTTVFVVDVSESMGDGAREAARSWVDSALADADGAEWAVVEFGADARVGTPLGTETYRGARGVETDATNVSRGLRLGESVLTGETRQRLVLVSDGRSNTGDLQAELDRLETLGVEVDVHTVEASSTTDAAVSAVDMPSSVNVGESFDVTVEVLSTVSGDAVVELSEGSDQVGAEEVALSPGPNYVTFNAVAGDPGLQQFSAAVRMIGDAVAENDSLRAGVEVRGPASVMIVEGEEDGGEILERALNSRGLEVERVAIADMPGIEELSIHRAAMLVDVSVRDMSETHFGTLSTFVRDLGRGMVVVGGTHSYGLGGYRDTPLEALLPVDSEAPDTQRQAEVAEVLLIDTSESMGACHCEENGFIGREQGGVNKTDISRAAAVRAIEALGSGDEIGVLAFSGTAEWAVPLQEFPDRQTIDAGLAGLRPFGETRVVPAIEEAADELLASDKELKHIILFSDGFTTELEIDEFIAGVGGEDLIETVEEIAAQGITVSVVGTGEGAIPALEEVAEAGNGRFYPGRDLNEIPEIFVEEARLASRSFINEGEFFPVVTSTANAVRDIASSPAILGYVATTPKPTAEIQLQVGPMSDPLLAAWRVGLGKVTAWTSDGGERWGSQWAGWDGFSDFWSTLVRDTFPLSGSAGQRIEASIADEMMQITLESAEEWPAGTEPIARISYPDGTSEEVALDRISDVEFGATVPARQGGTYAVGARVDGADGETAVLSTLATRSFAAEYLPGEPNADLMASVSSSTGGRGEIEAVQAFDAEGLDAGVTERQFRWWFLLLAALLWPIDVALRRLRLSRREQPDRPDPSGQPRPTPTSPEAARTH